jgi:hypothetical protein
LCLQVPLMLFDQLLLVDLQITNAAESQRADKKKAAAMSRFRR